VKVSIFVNNSLVKSMERVVLMLLQVLTNVSGKVCLMEHLVQ